MKPDTLGVGWRGPYGPRLFRRARISRVSQGRAIARVFGLLGGVAGFARWGPLPCLWALGLGALGRGIAVRSPGLSGVLWRGRDARARQGAGA